MTSNARLFRRIFSSIFHVEPDDYADPEAGTLLHHEPSSSKNNIVRQMACLDDDTSVVDLEKPMKAYFELLDTDLQSIPATLTDIIKTPSLTNVSPYGLKDRLYSIIFTIARTLRQETGYVFLMQVCEELVQLGLVSGDENTIGAPNGTNTFLGEGAKKTAQLVFILFGFLTKLFDPEVSPDPGKLQITRAASDRDFTPQRRSTRTWQYFEQDIPSIGENIAWDELLFSYAGFRRRIFRPRLKLPREHEVLRSQDVSFFTLASLLNVKIVWTTSICEHLEFNVKSKEVKIFRLPSYCVMLCTLEPDRTFLDQLLRQIQRLPTDTSISFADYMREVLCTYRLIFGQHKDARKLIKQYCGRGRIFGLNSPFRSHHPSALVRGAGADPLLEELCFKDSRNVEIFAELDMLDVKQIYLLNIDFPNFAERLAALQSFSENQLTYNWKVLWRDRRDIAKFWTFWAVLLVGVPSIVLSVIQTILTGFQLRS